MAVGAGVGGMRVRAGTLGMQRRKKMWTSWEMQMEVRYISSSSFFV
jgi:hypothetical protein